MRSRVFAVALTSALAAGCGQATDSVTPTASTPNFAAHCGGCWSRGNVVWHDTVNVGTAPAPSWVPAGIRGDGRDKFGQLATPLNEYQGDFCGVRAFLYDGKGESGNLDFDPDTYYDATTMSSACGAVRSMAFHLEGQSAPATAAGPHVIVSALWKFAPGEVRLQPQTFGMQGVTCGLRFDAQYTGASNVRVTRLPDLAGAIRQWRMESQGNHQAACTNLDSRGRPVDTGIRYYLPFAVTITQVPYTGATYP